MKRSRFWGKASEQILQVLSETSHTGSHGRFKMGKIVKKLPQEVIEIRTLANPLRYGFPEWILAGKRRHQTFLRQFAASDNSWHWTTEQNASSGPETATPSWSQNQENEDSSVYAALVKTQRVHPYCSLGYAAVEVIYNINLRDGCQSNSIRVLRAST